jgi:dipeptidyl aminopeptidase/acylaminoacyl peptidase
MLFRSASAAALMFVASAALSQPAHSLSEDAKAFGTREFLRQVDISPSGKKVVMLVSAAGASTTANIIDVATSKITRLGDTDGKPAKLYSCSFAGEEHVVCHYGGIDHVGVDLVGFSRMFVVNADGTKLRQLGQQESDRALYLLQSDADVIDWMTGSEGKLLMEREYVPESVTGHLINRQKEGLGVDLVDVETLKSTPVEPPRAGASDYLTDGRGNVRVVSFVDSNPDTGQLSGVRLYRYRLPGSKEWIDLGQFDSVARQGIQPLAVDADRNALFALQRMNGRDALVQIALDAGKSAALVAKNDRVDIDGVVRVGRGQRVIGYTFADERRRVVYFDPEFQALHDSLMKALKSPGIDFEQASSDGQHLLIRASADKNPGRFYIYSRPSHALTEVGPIRPELEGRDLAAMQAIEIPAPDGAMVPAYLTLPPGSSGKNLPAVVLPHGGPSSRDEWGFDWLVQFLAARGYAVIQPEFRGSDGFGDAWLNKNGFQNWRTSIGDVTAAAQYLVAKGIADPNRLAIFGWSYGGYAALQSAATQPSMYKAVVAIAPLTDFAMAEKEAEYFTNRDIVRRIIGKGPHIVEGSPLQQAQRIKAPVLLVHGDMDANVSIRESEAMLSALTKAGAPVDMLRFKGLDHQLDDSDARIAMLMKAGELLDRTIGH